MTKEEFLNLSRDHLLGEIKKLLYLFSHQEIIRHGLSRNTETFQTQSVSEHIYNMMTLSQFFLPLEDPEGRLDKNKITQLILWHDIEEIETEDIPKHLKTAKHEAQASMAFNQVVQKIPSGLNLVIRSAFTEYEAQQTLESQFVKALDRTEMAIEDFKEAGKARLLDHLQVSTDDLFLFSKLATKATKNFPCMGRVIQLRYEPKHESTNTAQRA